MTGERALKDTDTMGLGSRLIDRSVCAQRREGDKIGDQSCDQLGDKMCDKLGDKMCDKTVSRDAAKKEAVGRAQ